MEPTTLVGNTEKTGKVLWADLRWPRTPARSCMTMLQHNLAEHCRARLCIAQYYYTRLSDQLQSTVKRLKLMSLLVKDMQRTDMP